MITIRITKEKLNEIKKQIFERSEIKIPAGKSFKTKEEEERVKEVLKIQNRMREIAEKIIVDKLLFELITCTEDLSDEEITNNEKDYLIPRMEDIVNELAGSLGK